jgi:hypothetical protein
VAARDQTGSSSEVLRKIGLRLGELTTNDPTMAVVASPLLGTGAGRVPIIPAVQALTDGFRLHATPHALLSLCAPRGNSYRKLVDWYSTWQIKSRTPPRVFLSYNQATQSAWVKELHEFLRSQGINAVVDRWELKVMMDLNTWMAQEISRADKVVIISDEEYARKADNREGGVGEETLVIEADLNRHVSPQKYVPIVRCQEIANGTPAFLGGRLVIHCPSDEKTASVYQRILQAIHSDSSVAPPIGESPLYLKS